jgi:ADP-heptose:LPS heptosyltransferase
LKPQTVRLIDLWLGRPLCFGLTLLRRAGQAVAALGRRAGAGSSGAAAQPVRKILLIKMIEQGATVLAYRAIERAVEAVGRENVYFWVFAGNRAILDVLGLIPRENVLALRSDNLFTFAFDVLKSLLTIRRLGIDATVDMEFFARAPAVLAFLTGARRRVGLHRFTSEGPYRGDLLTHRVAHNPYLHTAVSYYLLVEALQSDLKQVPLPKVPVPRIDFSPPVLEPTEKEVLAVRRAISEALLEAGGSNAASDEDRRSGLAGPLILLNPNAGDLLPLRRWPTERFIELGRRMLQDDPTAVLAITGAPSEREAAEAVTRELRSKSPGDSGRVICMAGRTSLGELIVLYTLADLLVTNDSGPGHFASLTDLPTLVLFGPETPALFAPLGKGTHVMTANLACSPCVNAMNHRFSPCNDNVCMQDLSVDQVYARCRDLLPGRRTPKLELTIFGQNSTVAAASSRSEFGPGSAAGNLRR